jgi:hypothetical protein
MRFTMGTGGAGIEREAYYVGWLVIGDLLQRGWTYSRLARVTDHQMTRIVSDSLTHLQSSFHDSKTPSARRVHD